MSELPLNKMPDMNNELDGHESFGHEADMADAIAAANERAERAELALARTQGSLPMTVGQLVIDAGQSPKRLLALPFTLLRIRVSRRAGRSRLAERPEAAIVMSARDTGLSTNPARVLTPRRTVTTDDRPSIVAIAPPEVIDALGGFAHVSQAWPHDVVELVRLLDPDGVIVHAHAGQPGTPWFPLGEPGEAVRERTLLEVRAMCQRLGRPILIVTDPSRAPGLTEFARGCDRSINVSDATSTERLIAALMGTELMGTELMGTELMGTELMGTELMGTELMGIDRD